MTYILLTAIVVLSVFDLFFLLRQRREILALRAQLKHTHKFLDWAIPQAYERGWRERGAFSAPIVYGATVLKEKSN